MHAARTTHSTGHVRTAVHYLESRSLPAEAASDAKQGLASSLSHSTQAVRYARARATALKWVSTLQTQGKGNLNYVWNEHGNILAYPEVQLRIRSGQQI